MYGMKYSMLSYGNYCDIISMYGRCDAHTSMDVCVDFYVIDTANSSHCDDGGLARL